MFHMVTDEACYSCQLDHVTWLWGVFKGRCVAEKDHLKTFLPVWIIEIFWEFAEMAKQVNFGPLLKKKYYSFTVEVKAFLDSCEVSSSIDIAMDIIYTAIKECGKSRSRLENFVSWGHLWDEQRCEEPN